MCQDQKRLEFFSPSLGPIFVTTTDQAGPQEVWYKWAKLPSSLGLVMLCRSQPIRYILGISSCRSVVQQGVIFSSWGLGAVSGDIFGCYNWGGCFWHLMGRGQGRCPTSCNAQGSPKTKKYQAHHVHGAEGSGSLTRMCVRTTWEDRQQQGRPRLTDVGEGLGRCISTKSPGDSHPSLRIAAWG